jgi:predicted KAP-like P-loop ATPase
MFSASLQATKDAPIAINFDAWGRDFSENPFASFCDEIHRELVKHDETKGVERASKFLQKAKGVLGTMIGGSIRVGSTFATAFAAVHSGGDPQVAASAAKAADQVAKGIADKLQEAAHKAPDARAAFRLVLNKIVTELQSEGDHAGKCQFIIFVDELDRCRPDFAMRLLETIKHFFDIPGITFVLAYDEMFLSSAAKSLYGPSFDADNYLRRFIDVRFWLPQNEQPLLLLSFLNDTASRRTPLAASNCIGF